MTILESNLGVAIIAQRYAINPPEIPLVASQDSQNYSDSPVNIYLMRYVNGSP